MENRTTANGGGGQGVDDGRGGRLKGLNGNGKNIQ